MDTSVMEYKCPCCNAGLTFSGDSQQLSCEYCGTNFDIEAVKAYNESISENAPKEDQWENAQQEWSQEEASHMKAYQCPSCGAQIMADETTAASFCPYCENPTIIPAQLSGGLKPDAVIPFKTTKEDAKAAFLNLCKGKKLLPKFFTSQQRLEKITGMYVPFWLYDCEGAYDGSFKATRLHHWSDSNYNYTRTDHYMLTRQAEAVFEGIPMDGSTKMDDIFMESIEPYDYGELKPFDSAYLTGYLADKYDVESAEGEARVQKRVENSMEGQVESSLIGFSTVVPTSRNIHVKQGNVRYVLLPVWMLNTQFQGKIYTFAMNGQTGKMTGAFPICPKRTAMWFAGIFAGVSAVASLIIAML